MSQYYNDVVELNYEQTENTTFRPSEASEVLHESDVDHFHQIPHHDESTEIDSYNFPELSMSVTTHKDREVICKAPEIEDNYGDKHTTATHYNNVKEYLADSPDENSNHSANTHQIDEDMGSAKKAAYVYQEVVVNKNVLEKKRDMDEDNDRAELSRKKKVSDLISRFNSGEAYNQNNTFNSSEYKGAYGVGKVGAVNTGKFK